jgi:hypothetical protein
LDEEIKKLRENECNLDRDKVKENWDTYGETITAFFEKMIKLFGDLEKVLKNDFEFSYRDLDLLEIANYEYIEFSAINMTQKPAFLRRLEFLLCDKKGEILIRLFRGKHDKPADPWKFHDEQEYHFDIEKLDEKLAYELVDWFAWKRYSPRSIR